MPCIGVYALRVMSTTSGLFSDVLRAYNWLVENAASLGIRVVNVSLEGPSTELTEECNQMRKLTQMGITVVAAAGVCLAPVMRCFVLTMRCCDATARHTTTADVNCPHTGQ